VFGSGSTLDRDLEGGKSAPKRRKIKTEDQKKYENLYFLSSHILCEEFGLKMFNVRKIR
jgi:hypothetical protein